MQETKTKPKEQETQTQTPEPAIGDWGFVRKADRLCPAVIVDEPVTLKNQTTGKNETRVNLFLLRTQVGGFNEAVRGVTVGINEGQWWHSRDELKAAIAVDRKKLFEQDGE